jgi:membrane protease YdiL (CAAX protease family)
VTRWAAFAGIVALVLGALLALARASQSTASDAAAAPPGARVRPNAPDDTDGAGALGSDGIAPNGDSTDGENDSVGAGADDCGATDADVGPRTDDAASARPPWAANGRESLPAGALLANVALSQGFLLVLVVLGAWYARVPPAALGVRGTPPSTGLPALAAGVGLGLALALANELGAAGADALGVKHAESLRGALAPESRRGWLVLLVGVLPTVALFEELLFRAALVGALSAGFGLSPWLLAVFSSVAFALGHGAQGALGMAVTGALGFVLAAAFVLTGSLLAVVVAHYLVNAAEFVVHERLDVGPSG